MRDFHADLLYLGSCQSAWGSCCGGCFPTSAPAPRRWRKAPARPGWRQIFSPGKRSRPPASPAGPSCGSLWTKAGLEAQNTETGALNVARIAHFTAPCAPDRSITSHPPSAVFASVPPSRLSGKRKGWYSVWPPHWVPGAPSRIPEQCPPRSDLHAPLWVVGEVLHREITSTINNTR